MPISIRLLLYRLFAVLGLLLAATQGVHSAEGTPGVPVVVAPAESREMSSVVWMAGSVISRRDAQIAAEVAGRLVSIAEIGTDVAEGDPVARLDDAQLGYQREEIQAEVNRDTARVTFLQQEVGRLALLARQNNAAKTQLEQTEADLGVARGELASAGARLKQVEDLLRHSVVRAPFRGTVVRRLMQAGEWADRGDVLVRLVDTESVEVQTMVPLTVRPYLQKGMPLVLSGDDGIVTGALRSLVNAGDIQSRLLDLRIDFNHPGWLPGQTLRVAVPSSSPRQVTAVSRDALVLRRSGTAVFKVGPEGEAERVEVTVGVAQGEFIEVRGAISPGDQVIVRGGERLRPGQKVRILVSDKR